MSRQSEFRREHPESDWVCETCGNNVGKWYYGWKHQAGGKSQKSCKSPRPILRSEVERRDREAWSEALSAIQGRIRLPERE